VLRKLQAYEDPKIAIETYIDVKFTFKKSFKRMKKVRKHAEKKDEPPNLSEKDRFMLRVRAQLTKTNTNTDTYFAIDRANGQNVVVKGPYLNKNITTTVMQIVNIKKMLDLPYVAINEIFLVPDQFGLPANTPVGLRSFCEPDQAYPFLISEDVCFCRPNKKDIPTMYEKTNQWSKTLVLDPKRFEKLSKEQTKCRYALPSNILANIENLKSSAKIKSTKTMLMYLLILVFRHSLGISDPTIQNFLHDLDNHVVYAVDEEVMWKRSFDKGFWHHLNANEIELVKQFSTQNWELMRLLIKRLYRKIKSKKDRISLILGKDKYKVFYNNVRSLSKYDNFIEKINKSLTSY